MRLARRSAPAGPPLLGRLHALWRCRPPLPRLAQLAQGAGTVTQASLWPSSAHTCQCCGCSFPSRNKLFAHLRASSPGSSFEQTEKVALVLGCTGSDPEWRSALWRGIDAARGLGAAAVAGDSGQRESYSARGGAPGAAFASDGRGQALLQHEVGVPRLCDVLSFTTEVLQPPTEDERAAWCARANAALPHSLRILGRSVALPSSFNADLCCLRQRYECLLPLSLLAPEGTNKHSKSSWGAAAELAAVAAVEDTPTAAPGEAHFSSGIDGGEARERCSQRRNNPPKWGEGVDGDTHLVHFHRLKYLLQVFRGEQYLHNFAVAPLKLVPSSAVARRFIFRFWAHTAEGGGTLTLAISADALLRGQLRAMAGIVVAIQQGLLPETYLGNALSKETVVHVPVVPAGTVFLAGLTYSKRYHWLLQPIFNSTAAHQWRQAELQRLALKVRSGEFEAWCHEELVPTITASPAPQAALPVPALRGDGSACEPDPAAEMYAAVLLLLREADASGLWPETSVARKRVIKGLHQPGGQECAEGGSFTLGAAAPGLEPPGANELFPELMARAFELERALRPGRPPSSSLAVNRRAHFLPHVDWGAGAGQGTSLIVGLGDYTGGALVVEGVPHDIRYAPLEFCGWTQRHWTAPFAGERFTLVFFTPTGCQAIPQLPATTVDART